MRRHWWNRKWGRPRRDIWVYDLPTWTVEARLGGGDGVSEAYPASDEAKALAMVEQLLADGGDWVELSARPPGT